MPSCPASKWDNDLPKPPNQIDCDRRECVKAERGEPIRAALAPKTFAESPAAKDSANQ